MFQLIGFCILLLVSATYGRHLDDHAKSKRSSTDDEFVQKVVELKQQASRLLALRGKKVDPQGNVTADASWGDIQLNEAMYQIIKKNFDEEEKRLTSKNETDRTTAPNFKIIPYSKWTMPIQYTTFLVTDEKKLPLITEAISHIQDKTCIHFLKVDAANGPHIEFTETDLKGQACANSPLGMQAAKNVINIDPTCSDSGTYVHEMLHTLGFAHTQSRPDVEQYIKFNWDNIKKDATFNFKPWAYALVNQGPYDYGSIMHYEKDAYAIDQSKPTMEAVLDPEVNNALMGHVSSLSVEDVRILNMIYCGNMDTTSNGCIDKDADCAHYAAQGACETDTQTKQNCDYSCKRCTHEPSK